jgi:Uma2 family endonuclease
MADEITNFNQLDLNKSYTYADYIHWRFQERVEIIMGKIFKMSPAPTSVHQKIVSEMHGAFHHFLKGKQCQVFPSPFDVILTVDGIESVVQPDITVVCDPLKVVIEGCNGTPDLTVEVVSRSSVKKDLHEKYELYEKAGVAEYWLANPADRSIIIFSLQTNGKYAASKPLIADDVATSTVLPGFYIPVADLFVNLAEEPEETYRTAGRI